MAPGLQRTSFNSSGLVRLLAGMAGAGGTIGAGGAGGAGGAATAGTPSNQTLAERLGLWLDWTDAITLSAALHGAPPAARPATETGTPGLASAIADEYSRVRSGLAKAIAADALFAVGKTGPLHGATDFSTCRRAYLLHQRAMAARLGALRARVRAALSKAAPNLQRLAALDAAMDAALAAREGHLLAKVPGLLERHFMRLRQAQPETLPDTGQPHAPGSCPPSTAWLAGFLDDMQAVLLAELDLRMQPIEAMVDVLTSAVGDEAARRT